MNPIPAEAMPVVEILRLDVRRPRKLPLIAAEHSLRWAKRRWYEAMFQEEPTFYCPMGLHHMALSATPVDRRTFHPSVTDEAVRVFFRWWDNLKQEDAAEAVEAIWPRRKP